MAQRKSLKRRNIKIQEGFTYRFKEGVKEITYFFDSPFGKLIPIIMVILIPLAIMAVKLDKFYDFLIFSALLLIALLYLFYKKTWAFGSGSQVVTLQRNMSLGEKDKPMGPIEDAIIVKEVMKKTTSAKANIVSAREVKKLSAGVNI